MTTEATKASLSIQLRYVCTSIGNTTDGRTEEAAAIRPTADCEQPFLEPRFEEKLEAVVTEGTHSSLSMVGRLGAKTVLQFLAPPVQDIHYLWRLVVATK